VASAKEIFEALSIIDVVIPFLLIFSVTFALLQKVKLFDHTHKQKQYNIPISIVLAFIFILNVERVNILNAILIKTITVLIAGLFLQMIVVALLGKYEMVKKWYTSAFIIGVFFLIVLTTFDWFKLSEIVTLLEFLINPALIGLVVFVLIMWFITREDGTGSSGSNGSSAPNRPSTPPAPSAPQPTPSAPQASSAPRENTGPSTRPPQQGNPNARPGELVRRIEGDDLKGDDRVIWKG
jgi:hypothetical protein